MNEFQLVHTYIKAANDGKAKFPTCSCGNRWIPSKNKNGDLVFWCPFEDTETVPGAALLDGYKRTLKELRVVDATQAFE